MRQVILSIKDYIFADAVASTLRKDPKSDFAVQTTRSPEEIVQYCRITTPYALLMEVTGYPPYLLTERLKTRQEVKRDAPGCKIVLVVDENSESKLAEQVRQAKKDGLIDQFIYGSISAGYLVALIDTL